MKKKILIIGAGFLQNFVIKKAKEMGYITLAVDANPDSIGFKNADKHKVVDIIDKDACLQYAREEKIDGVLTAATDYGVLTTAYIAEKMGLPGISYEVASLIKNKYKVRECLQLHHVDDTEDSYEVDKNTDVKEISKHLTYPVMVKPCDGSGSRGASRVDDAEHMVDACHFAMESSLTHKAEIESFIHGKEYGAETLVSKGEIYVMAIVNKWMTKPPYYAELGHGYPNDLSKEIEAKAIECVRKAVYALGVTSGSVNMDLMITEEGSVHIVDIGARMGGNMIGPRIIPYGTGIDYMGNMLRNAVGDDLDWTKHENGALATKLLAFKGGVIKRLPDFENMQKEYNVEILHHMEVGDVVNEYHTNLDGCGYIVAKRNTMQEAEADAYRVLKIIEKEIF